MPTSFNISTRRSCASCSAETHKCWRPSRTARRANVAGSWQSFQQWWRWTRWRRSSSPRTSMAIFKPCLWEILNWWKLMETDGNWCMNWRYSIAQPRRSDLYLVKFQVPKTQHTQWSILAWKPMGPRVLHSRTYQGCIWTQLANAIGPSAWAGEHP